MEVKMTCVATRKACVKCCSTCQKECEDRCLNSPEKCGCVMIRRKLSEKEQAEARAAIRSCARAGLLRRDIMEVER